MSSGNPLIDHYINNPFSPDPDLIAHLKRWLDLSIEELRETKSLIKKELRRWEKEQEEHPEEEKYELLIGCCESMKNDCTKRIAKLLKKAEKP